MKSVLIYNSNGTLYKTFKDLYTTSFPIFEQRTDEQQNNAFEKKNYYLISYLDEDRFVGFISYWDFNTYVYIEHFAVNTEIRGKGYGSKILELFKKSVNKTVILEIDPIKDEISKARLRFYIKNGFYENIYNHHHPVYREGFKPHELIVMTTQRPLSVKEYLGFK